MTHVELSRESGMTEMFKDPSLVLALTTGSALTVFLMVAHSCCLGLADRHLAPLLQICSFAG